MTAGLSHGTSMPVLHAKKGVRRAVNARTARPSCPVRGVESATEGCLRSFQLTNQAIDSYQNPESEMHSHRHNKHQDPYLDAYNLCCQQKNDHACETHERCNDANDKLWRPILRHRSSEPSRCVRLRPSWRRRVGTVGDQFRWTAHTFYLIGRMIVGSQ